MARKGKNRDEELVGAELVLTAHHEFFDSLPDEIFWQWVKTNVKFLQQKYDGQNNKGLLVNAILHMDEKAPHIHAVIAPVIEKARRNPVTKEMMPTKRQLNYSEIFMDRNEVLWQAKKEGRSHLDTKLGRLQTDYAEAMKIFGLVRGRELHETQVELHEVVQKLVKEKAVYEQALKIVRRGQIQLEGQRFAEEMAVLRGRHLEQQHLKREAAKQRQPAHHSMGV